jgi:uncharacterized protein (DUF58 family)
LFSVVLLLLGVYKGVNLLCLLAYFMLICLLLNVLLARRRLPQVRGSRRMGVPAFAGLPFVVELRAVNEGKSALFGVGLEDEEPMRTGYAFAPRLAAGQTFIHRRQAILPARGRYAWGPVDAVSGYPFGLAQQRCPLVAAEDVLILPRLGQLHRGRLRRFLLPVGQAYVPTRQRARRQPTAQAEFHGLRAFRSGDSPRWIHWRTSARCGELMVREFEDVPTDNQIVIVDPVRAEGLETIISLAATIAWEWCRQKGDHFVLAVASAAPIVVSGTTGPEHALRVLQCLAALDGEADPDATPLLNRLATAALPLASVLVVSPRDPAPLQTKLSLRLHRPVAGLGIDRLADCDFYAIPVPPLGNAHAT